MSMNIAATGLARGRAAALLLLLTGIAPVVTAATNRLAGEALASASPGFGWIASAAIPSCALIACLYAGLGDRAVLRWPIISAVQGRQATRLALLWMAIWVAGTMLAAARTGHRITYTQGAPGLAAFLLFGPVGEELLFRGLIYGYARRVWPGAIGPAVLLSTATFSLHHLFIATAPPGLLLAQVAFTVPMGVVFALLRSRTGSLWPGLFVHLLTNIVSAL